MILFKKIPLLIVVFISLFFHFSCKKDDKTISNPNAETLVHDGIEREYLLHLPQNYDGTTAIPVMLNFHGFGGTATDHRAWADMRSLADSENFILVYPQGTLLDGSPHWNAGLDTPDNKSDADDFGFVEALLNELATNYNIDEERVYACGYSNGAFFSYALACFLSDKIAAIGSVSGTMLSESFEQCNAQHPTAMINLHGTSDGVVPYNGGVGLTPIQDVVDFWVNFNASIDNPVVNTVNNIEQHIYNNDDGGVAIEHYKINGGEHVWFDINFNGKNTNQLIWDYVSQYDVNGRR